MYSSISVCVARRRGEAGDRQCVLWCSCEWLSSLCRLSLFPSGGCVRPRYMEAPAHLHTPLWGEGPWQYHQWKCRVRSCTHHYQSECWSMLLLLQSVIYLGFRRQVLFYNRSQYSNQTKPPIRCTVTGHLNHYWIERSASLPHWCGGRAARG